MSIKAADTVRTVLRAVAIILLLAAAFDITHISDNLLIFLALGCFMISGVIKISKEGGCCR